jgi:hypothetical protein
LAAPVSPASRKAVELSEGVCRLLEVTVESYLQMIVNRPSVRPSLTAARVFALAAMMLVLPTAVARAQPDPLGIAEQTAESYWGDVPCGGQVTVQWQSLTPPPALPGTEVEAWVTFQTPAGPLDFAEPPSTYSSCVVNISSILWPSYTTEVEAYPQFCEMIVHEFGHFEGYADSTSYPSSDIRYPLLTDANLPGACDYELTSAATQTAAAPALSGAPTARARTDSVHFKRRCFEVGCMAHPRRARLPRR